MIKKTLLIISALLLQTSQVRAQATQSPLRIKVSKDALTKVMNMRDQEVFMTFTDKEVTSGGSEITKITYSLSPAEGDLDDFDFDTSFTKENLGVESTKVKVSGTAVTKDGAEIKFTAPVPLVKLQYELGTKYNEQFKFDALSFNEKEWIFKVGDVTGEGLSDGAQQEIAAAIEGNVDEFKLSVEKKDQKETVQNFKNFPMDAVIPMVSLYHVVQFSEIFDVDEKYFTLGFNLNHFKMLTDKQNNMLK